MFIHNAVGEDVAKITPEIDYPEDYNGAAEEAKAERDGNERYEYFFPMDDPETVLLIDAWRDRAALDAHHASGLMREIAALREKYDLHMRAERYLSAENDPADTEFIRK